MDELELLRRTRDDVAPPRPAAVEQGRRALLERIADSAPGAGRAAAPDAARPRGVPRRTAVVLAAACAAAGGLTAALVAGPPSAPASAAGVLQRASRWASTTSLAAPGTVTEFRRVDLLTEADDTVRRESTTLLKVPTDGGLWVRRTTFTSFRFAYGDRSAMRAVDPRLLTPFFETSSDGAFAAGGSDAPVGLGADPDRLAALPHDPDGLLRVLRNDPDEPAPGTAWAALGAAEGILERGTADSGLQARVFAALQREPGLTIVDDHAVDLYGRTGVAIAVRPGTPDPTGGINAAQLLIDPGTGRFLGVRAVALHAAGSMPVGADMGATAVRTDVATTAEDWEVPQGGRVVRYP